MRMLFLQQWFSDEVLKALGWTLIHSLWQGLLAAVLAGIIIINTGKSEARLRYNLLGAVLVLFVMGSVITFLQQLKGGVLAEKTFAVLTVPVTESSFVAANYGTDSAPAGTTIDKFVAYFNSNADLFVLIWAVFFLIHCIKLVTGLAGIQRIRNYKIHPSPDEWRMKLDHLTKILGIKRSVNLFQSELVKTPVAIGLFKPVILVPLGLLSNLPPEQVETILLHELAHVRRKDYLVNILQRFAEAVFFFNPALLWISALTRQEREACCDDIVVANTTHKGSYLEALVSFQEYSLAASGYAMAISSKRNYLLNRVKRMVTRENKKLDIMEKILLVVGMAAVTAFTFIPQKEAAREKNLIVIEPVKDPAKPKPIPGISLQPPPPARKTFVKKEIKRPGFKVAVNKAPVDTVPPSAKRKETTGYDELKFPSISSSIDDDGKTRTETTTVTDQDGKKYTYTKLNNKITGLSINGKTIPENEIGNYSALFEKIEMSKQANRAMRLKDMELRKYDMAKRIQANKMRIAENQKLRDADREIQKEYLKSKKIEFENQERIWKKERIKGERERTIRLKQIEKNGRKIILPLTINGREVVRQNGKTQNCIDVNVSLQNEFDVNLQKKAVVNLQNKLYVSRQNKVDVNMQKVAVNLQKADVNVQKLAVNLQNKLYVDLQNRVDVNMQNKLDVNLQYKPELKPVRPLKPVPGAIPSKEASPVKPGKNFEYLKKRVTT